MFYGWRVVGGIFVSQLFVVGFFTYAASMLVAPVREEFGVSLEQVMYGLTAGTFFGLFLTPLAGVMIDRYPVRWLMTGGAVGFTGGLWLLSQAPTITAYVWIFGFTMSISNIFAGAMCGSAVIARWFTASRGRALGVSAIGVSVGGVLLPWLLNQWIQDHGWRVALEHMAAGGLFFMVPLVFLTVRGKPADVGLEPEADGLAPGVMPEDEALTLLQVLRSRGYWLLGVSLGILFSAYSSTLSNMTPYILDLGHGESQASTMIMTIAISGFFGKLLFGVAADKLSLKLGLWITQFALLTGFLILAAEPAFSLMLVAAGVIGLSAGGMLPIWGAMMARIFGLLSYGRAMGLMGPLITLCVMPGYTLVGRLYDISGSYVPALLCFSVGLVVSALLIVPLQSRDGGKL